MIALAGVGIALVLGVGIDLFKHEGNAAIPDPDLSHAEAQVATLVRQVRGELTANPRSAEAWGKFAAACHAHDLTDAAAASYSRAAELNSRDFRWPYLQAILLEDQGQSEAAVIEMYRRALSRADQYAPLRCRLGDALVRAGRTKDSLQEYESALRIDNAMAAAHRGLGQALLAVGETSAALSHLQRADELTSGDVAVLAAMSQALARLGQADRARTLGKQARQSTSTILLPDPVYYMVQSLGVSAADLEERSKSLLSAGDIDGAIKALTILQEVCPNDALVQSRFGRAQLDAGRLDEAERHWRRALELNPSLEGARMGLASILESRGAVDEAIEQYRIALQLNDRRAEAHYGLGVALQRTGRVSEAIVHFRRAAQLDPSNPAARGRLTELGAAP